MHSAISVRHGPTSPERLDIRLIGKVRVSHAGHPLEIGGSRLQSLLATLILAEGHPLSTEDLTARVWDDRENVPPARVHEGIRDLREYITRAIGGGAELLPRDSAGYRAGFGRADVDLYRFQDRRREAAPMLQHDDMAAVHLLHQALDEWGGRDAWEIPEPFAGLGGSRITDHRYAVLADYRTTMDACLQAELRLGRHEELIPTLVGRIRAEPADEKLIAMVMLAYYRSGRQSDATALYRTTERRLDAEGLLASDELRRLHELILRHDSALDLPPGGPLGLSPGGAGEPGGQPAGQPVADTGSEGQTTGGPATTGRPEPATEPATKRKRKPAAGSIQIGGHGAVFTGGKVEGVHVGDTVYVGDPLGTDDRADRREGGTA